jgi:hypothetical protein
MRTARDDARWRRRCTNKAALAGIVAVGAACYMAGIASALSTAKMTSRAVQVQ